MEVIFRREGMRTKKTVGLNKLDKIMLFFNEVIPAATQVLTFRFQEPHSVEEIHEAMRYMMTIYPRLRSVLYSTIFSHRLRILDDNARELEKLFEEAFRVKNGVLYDTDEYRAYRRDLLNEPFALQQELPIKMRYLPDDPQPVLLLSLHHMVGDGMSWLHLENSLLKYLNGQKPPQLPLDNPNMLPALLKKPYYTFPLQVWRSYQLLNADAQESKGRKMISASTRPANVFGPADAYLHILPFDLERIRNKGKEMDVGINILLLAALVLTVSRGQVRDQGDVIGVAIPVDLRPYYECPPIFGNFVVNFWVRINRSYWDDPYAMIMEIRRQMRLGVNRYKNKEMITLNLFEKLNIAFGKKVFAFGARLAKRKGLIPMTCGYSSIGNIDSVNSYGTRARVCETMSMVPHHTFAMVTMSLEGKLFAGFSYPEAEFDHNEIDCFIQAYDKTLEHIMNLQ
jgi:NRPS condensation-like uncharacterized protein